MKVLTVVGARPQFVKAAPVSQALEYGHEEVLVHTGQHYDERLSEVFFDELSVRRPDHDLDVGSGPHGEQIGRMTAGVGECVREEEPDVVLVYGDTNSTLAGAIAAAQSPAALAHVEAGLRSGDRGMPEEVNRVLTDHASDLLFAPTRPAVDNLAAEGLAERAHDVGDVMYDALLRARNRALDRSTVLEDFGVAPGEYVLATVHRAANTDDPGRLSNVLEGLSRSPRPVVLPIHPRTRGRIEEHGLEDAVGDAVRLVEPVGYLDFVRLVDGAERVATDSGGVQKEAFLLATPCVTFRDRTEWVNTVECGWNELTGADADAIAAALDGRTNRPDRPDLFGDGEAAPKVVEALAAAV
ncbi:non-hydrolyzing UDP-N-acetylglucosamine 2-epimerase [Halorarum salinum]|uniref:UDP-N-acetylglucosamine 2-epimerase (Non-hydrolyzing) n=1 Tax=Halorarum salinum TaxID=2743089 RepID=A0A7D5LDZ6_9EURY|nr:UDP-N-acetylglucosamine 2-epimerase (non-hydrolyzing) [Halobaculum salinum]QLG64328.1 UDP-N-acetylglucosamine 2-epimerase (non-hydrolyzing) [Halobaculum salinum]